MAVLDTERSVAPRSALRYRPLMTDQADGSGPPVLRSRRARADIPRTTASAVADDFDLEEERPPRSSRPGTLPPRWETVPAVRTRRRFHPLFWLGVSLGVLVLGWIGVTQAVTWEPIRSTRYGMDIRTPVRSMPSRVIMIRPVRQAIFWRSTCAGESR